MTAAAAKGAREARSIHLPNALVHLARDVDGPGDALLIAVAALVLRKLFKSSPANRARAGAPLGMIDLAAELGTRDLEGVRLALAALVWMGWIIREDAPGRAPRFSLSYGALGSEQGGYFCKLTEPEWRVLAHGSRGEQRTLGTVLAETLLWGREAIELRLYEFDQSHATTERAATELERCGIIEIERDRAGNVYRPTDEGDFRATRTTLRAIPGRRKPTARGRTFARSTPRVKVANAPGVEASNTPPVEVAITPPVEIANSRKGVLQGSLEGIQQQGSGSASPAAPLPAVAALASLGGEQQQRAPREPSPAVAGIVAKLEAAGFNDPATATTFAGLLLQHRDLAYLDAWLSESEGKARRGGFLRRVVIEPAIAGTWPTPPASRERSTDPRRGVCYSGTDAEFEEMAKKYPPRTTTTPHTPSQPSTAAKHLAQWRRVLELPADTPDAEVIAKAREFDASRKADGNALAGIAQAVGHAVGGRTRAAPPRPVEAPAPPPKRAGLLLDGTQDPAELERRKAEVRRQARIAAARSSAGSDPGGTSSYQCGGSASGAAWIAA